MADKLITDLQLRSAVVDALNFPSDDTIQSYRVTALQIYEYLRDKLKPESSEISNAALATSVASSALTVTLKTKALGTPSSTDKIRIAFRNATILTGDFSIVEIAAATSLVVSSGSTLGQISTKPARIFVYLINNAGTAELAVSLRKYNEADLVTTVAEGGAGAADSASVMYSTTARSNVACRLIGYIDNTQTTAGTWASAGTQIQLLPHLGRKPPTIQKFTSGSGTYYVPAGCTRIRVRLVGGGGGGGGSGGSSVAAGGAGGPTTFGTTLLSGSGGGLGTGASPGGGGAASLGTGPIGFANTGAGGSSGSDVAASSTYIAGGVGGSSPFGGAGNGGVNSPGVAGVANSGSGGGGGGGGNSVGQRSGGGGGAGGYVDAMIDHTNAAWATSFDYAIGAAGASVGSGGTAGQSSGAGGSGFIIVEEFYE